MTPTPRNCIICVTGTPGTGKTRLAKALAKTLSFRYLDLNALIEEKGWHEGKDAERDTLIVDERRLSSKVVPLVEDTNVVVDSHLSHFISAKLVALCIVCTCPLPVLKRRLERRGYSARKVRENLDAEIFEICAREAEDSGHKLLIVDTAKVTVESIVRDIRGMPHETRASRQGARSERDSRNQRPRRSAPQAGKGRHLIRGRGA